LPDTEKIILSASGGAYNRDEHGKKLNFMKGDFYEMGKMQKFLV
jgi:hypothetical protein